jgi:hypothetical protein
MLIILGTIQAKFILRVRRYHPDIWNSLGRPSFLPGLSPNRWEASRRINHYFYVRDFDSIGDAETRRLADRLWRVRRLFLRYVFGGTAVLLALMALTWLRIV